MRSDSLKELSIVDLVKLSMELDEYIATRQTDAMPAKRQPNQAAYGEATYSIYGNYSGEAYEVTPLRFTSFDNYEFRIIAPGSGPRAFGRQWEIKFVKARTLARAHAKAERKIRKRDKFYHKNLLVRAWARKMATPATPDMTPPSKSLTERNPDERHPQ